MAPEETKTEEGKVRKSKKTKVETEAMGKKEIVAAIKGMTVMDLTDLIKTLQDEFGVSAAPVAVGAVSAVAPGSQAAEVAAEEEKTEFTVVLNSIGEKKIEVIKAVRDITQKGLKESKDLVDAAASAPQVIKENAKKEESKSPE